MVTIVSSRKIFKEVWWQIVYDWEDEFSERYKLDINQIETLGKNYLEKVFFNERIYPFVPKPSTADYRLFFSMVAPYEFNFFSRPDYVPIIIDAWKPDLERVEKFCRFNKHIFLGSLEAVLELQQRGRKNVHYSPISISKKNKCLYYPDKDIDLFVYGRNHFVMFDWVEMLWNKTSLHIVKCIKNEQGRFTAVSNKKGFLGDIHERHALLSIVKKSKYVTVSSTGNDPLYKENIRYTGGYSPVTPRFLECTVNYAQGIGIFPDNPDFNFFDMKSVAVKAETFEAFEHAIHQEVDINIKDKFDAFLEKHWSEARIRDIMGVLNS